ncbi:DUF3168 domain-containing protein [Streptomyces sp. NPDC005805]|uniref:DUF3168 domain-containing protein n=1 Tax=Streptomyces sp. NPDC005805 TaxID=3157068 RepID=UPI0034067650
MDDVDLSILAELESNPDRIAERLSEADRVRLGLLLDLLADAGDEESLLTVGQAVASYLRARLPADDPLLQHWRSAGPGRSGAPVLLRRVAARHGSRPPGRPGPRRGGAPRAGTAGSPGGRPPAAAGWDRIRQRLLSAPSLSESQVRDLLRQDPRQPHLIRLTREDGEVRLPSFQFRKDGPVPLVLAINRVLRASEDPWGAADWWLGRNHWFESAPAEEVLDEDAADALMAAALAVGEGD